MNLSPKSFLSSDNRGYAGVLDVIILFRKRFTFILFSFELINSGKDLYKGKESSEISISFDVHIFWIIGSYPNISSREYFISQIEDDTVNSYVVSLFLSAVFILLKSFWLIVYFNSICFLYSNEYKSDICEIARALPYFSLIFIRYFIIDNPNKIFVSKLSNIFWTNFSQIS